MFPTMATRQPLPRALKGREGEAAAGPRNRVEEHPHTCLTLTHPAKRRQPTGARTIWPSDRLR